MGLDDPTSLRGIVFKVALALLCVGASSSAVTPQAYFHNRADFTVGNSPSAVVAADLNGDGKLDLAVANQGDNTVSILLGRPDGSFAAQTVYPTGTSPVALVAADFNGDGKLDLAVVNNNPGGAGSISILLGNGDGTFQSHVDYPVGASPIGIVAADFNGDKKPDLAVANNQDSTVSILLGNGDGTFQAQTTVSVGSAPVALSGGDFNGDGKLDLITSNSGSRDISVLLSNGDGSFSRIDSPAGGTPAGIAVGDFNRDGSLDVVVALTSSNPSILLGDGSGSFQSPSYIDAGPIASLVVAGDFDNDGNLDLAFGSEFAEILRGNGDGTFQEVSTSTEPGSASSIFVADFNGDGEADLAATVAYGTVVSILLGNGNCTFDSSVDFTLSPQQFVGPLVVTDLNGDGNPDVAWASGYGTTDTLTVLLGDGKGGLGSPIVTSLSAFPEAMVAGDFNGDGKTDLVWGGEFLPNAITVLPGNGDGTFGTPINTALPSSFYASQMAAGDFNGDGVTDLAVSMSNPSAPESALTIYLAQGNGTFVAGQNIVASSNYPLYVATGDFNHDGKLDLAYAAMLPSSSGAMYIMLGNGDGTFQSPASYAIPRPYGPPVVADVNGDGKLDLVVPANTGFSVLLGNGDGTFQNQIYTQSSVGDVPGHVVVADFNDDGKPDVAVDFPFSILLGNGDGTFQPPRAYAAGAGAIGLGSGDFNSDGIPDLVLGNPDKPVNASVDLFLSAPFISLSPGLLTFGSQDMGEPSTPQDVTLTNIGSAPLSLTSLTATGDFSETNTCGGTIAVGMNCVASVDFTPTVGGPRTGSLILADSASTSPQHVALAGTGLVPVAGVSPGTLTFSSQAVGSTSAAQTVMLTNTGSGALVISNIATIGDFSQTDTCGGSVETNASCAINVTFTPTAGGSRTGTLAITDNAPNSPQTVSLSGTGVAVRLSATSLSFGAQLVGSSSLETVTVTNLGSTPLSISSLTVVSIAPLTPIIGTKAEDFAIESSSCVAGGSVAGLGSCTINLAFKPTAAGVRTATLVIGDSDPSSPQTVSLRGTGTAVSLSATSLGFGPQPVDTTSAPKTVMLTNLGDTPLRIASLTLTGPDAGDFAIQSNSTCAVGRTVAGEGRCSINLAFKPSAAGARSATLVISDSDAGSPQTVSLSGTGTGLGLSKTPRGSGAEPEVITSPRRQLR